MEYTINQLAKLANITTRTLRYYDQIGLLKPSRMTQSGYRIYGLVEVDRLQQILFFRELELSLERIGAILNQPNLDYLTLLKTHRNSLVLKKQRIEGLIKAVDQTIAAKKGAITMNDKQKFTAFKTELIEKNENAYGTESREKYGERSVNHANAAMMNMTEEDYHLRESKELRLLKLLSHLKSLEIPSTEAEEIFILHKNWLTQAWGSYNAESHRGLGEMYTSSPEFTAYYDQKAGEGATLILNQIIQYYV